MDKLNANLHVDGHAVKRADGTIYAIADNHDVAELIASFGNSHDALVTELMAAQVQMNLAAECIQHGRYDEALLHVCSMGGKREAVLKLAKGE